MKYVTDKELYLSYKPRYNNVHTNRLKALSNCTKEKLSNTLDVIKVDKSIGSIGTAGTDILTNVIFVRDFQQRLLAKIRSRVKSVLIGNPGIGKSWFQFYYLARIVNPELYGPLPPDHLGCTNSPKVVIRQVQDAFYVHFIETRQVQTFSPGNINIFSCFDPDSSLYLYEPQALLKEPYYHELDLPILATVSPDDRRYKEFCKNSATKFYLPTWNLDDLLSIGKFMRENKKPSQDDQELYTDKQITGRYQEFGGILRHVFPLDFGDLDIIRKERDRNIHEVDAKYLLTVEGEIENNRTSHLLIQYKVNTSGNKAFKEYTTDFVNESIVTRLESKLDHVDQTERILTLRKNDEINTYMENACKKIYEDLILKYLISVNGVSWKQTKYNKEGTVTGEYPLKLKISKKIVGKVLIFNEMAMDTVYYSLNTIYPAFDFVYKIKEGDVEKLVCVQVTRKRDRKREVRQSALDKFLKEVGVTVEMIDFVLCPHPSYAKDNKIVITKTDPNINKTFYEPWKRPFIVWQVPSDYGRSFD